MTDDLVKRLRDGCLCNIDSAPCMAEEECRDAYTAADRIEELEAKVGRLRSHLQWIHDGAHTRGHTLPDIKERAGIALDGGEDRG